VFCWLFCSACMPMLTRTSFRKFSDGFEGSGPLHMPAMLRVIWTGVRMRPQGNPHQPNTAENSTPPNWLLVAQERQETCGLVVHRVKNRADQT